jgi:hypothetical protein
MSDFEKIHLFRKWLREHRSSLYWDQVAHHLASIEITRSLQLGKVSA